MGILCPVILPATCVVPPRNTKFAQRRAIGSALVMSYLSCIEIGQTTVARYLAKERRPPSQGWRTFISNHAEGIAALDLFIVPTLSFRLLFGLLILRHDRREILWLGVTAHPTAEWIAQQVTEAIGWERRRGEG